MWFLHHWKVCFGTRKGSWLSPVPVKRLLNHTKKQRCGWPQTKRSSAYNMSLILKKNLSRPKDGKSQLPTYACVGWTLAMTDFRGMSSMSLHSTKKHLPPSFPSLSISDSLINWACSSRGRNAVTLAPLRDASKASRTRELARSPIPCTFFRKTLKNSGRWIMLLNSPLATHPSWTEGCIWKELPCPVA